MPRTRDTRITGYEPQFSPAALLDELPLSGQATGIVEGSRAEVRAVLDGSDDRLLVIVGPCSVHDLAARAGLRRPPAGAARARHRSGPGTRRQGRQAIEKDGYGRLVRGNRPAAADPQDGHRHRDKPRGGRDPRPGGVPGRRDRQPGERGGSCLHPAPGRLTRPAAAAYLGPAGGAEATCRFRHHCRRCGRVGRGCVSGSISGSISGSVSGRGSGVQAARLFPRGGEWGGCRVAVMWNHLHLCGSGQLSSWWPGSAVAGRN